MDMNDRGVSRRRMMLVTGGAVAGAGALLAAPFREEIVTATRQVLASTKVGRRLLSLATASYEEWQSVVGSVFTLGGGATMTLVGVRPLQTSGRRPAGTRVQAFSAEFDAARSQRLAGDLIYTASHAEYGPLPIFLTLAATPGAPNRVLAIFN